MVPVDEVRLRKRPAIGRPRLHHLAGALILDRLTVYQEGLLKA